MSNFTSPGQESGHWQACCDAIENTAARLGVDPVAFAKACQDGEFLYDAFNALAGADLNPMYGKEVLRKLAALRRAEPQS